MYFSFSLLDNAVESIDAAVNLFEVLLEDGSVAADGGDEAKGNSTCGGPKVVLLTHVKDSLSCHCC